MHASYVEPTNPESKAMTAKAWMAALACAVLIAGCGAGGNADTPARTGSAPASATPANTATSPAPENPALSAAPNDIPAATPTNDIAAAGNAASSAGQPDPAPAQPSLLSAQSVYQILPYDAYRYGTLTLGAMQDDGFRPMSAAWTDDSGVSSAEAPVYSLGKDGWSLTRPAYSLAPSEDGTLLTLRLDHSGVRFQSRYREVDVSGKPVLLYIWDYLSLYSKDARSVLEATFPQGSRIGMVDGYINLDDLYGLGAQLAPYSLASQQLPSSIEDLFQKTSPADPVCVGGDQPSALVFGFAPGANSGNVAAYAAQNDADGGCAAGASLRENGTWELRQVSGASMLILKFPSLNGADLTPMNGGTRYPANSGILVTFNEIGGKLVEGYLLPGDANMPTATDTPAQTLLNQPAWDYLRTRLPVN